MDVPRFYRVTKKVLCHPVHGDAHPLSPKLQILASNVSYPLSAAFQARLPTCSCPLGDQPREVSMMFTSQEKTDPLYLSVNDMLNFLHTFHINQLSCWTITQLAQNSQAIFWGMNLLVVTTLSNHPFWGLLLKKTPYYYLFYIQDHVKQNRPGTILASLLVRKCPKEPSLFLTMAMVLCFFVMPSDIGKLERNDWALD